MYVVIYSYEQKQTRALCKMLRKIYCGVSLHYNIMLIYYIYIARFTQDNRNF